LLPGKGGPKKSKKSRLVGWFEKRDVKAELVVYTAEFTVDASFGEPGAVTVLNRHQREFFIESIVVEGFPSGPAHFACHSWVQPTRVTGSCDPRVFFSNKPYLPSRTPAGLRELRRQELEELRGSGTGERKTTDRAYDYDVYNDLGNPDKGAGFERPFLGGEKMPYPRRMRTARPSTVTGKSLSLLLLSSYCHHHHRRDRWSIYPSHKFSDGNGVVPDMAGGETNRRSNASPSYRNHPIVTDVDADLPRPLLVLVQTGTRRAGWSTRRPSTCRATRSSRRARTR
jgi:hypothetical protein